MDLSRPTVHCRAFNRVDSLSPWGVVYSRCHIEAPCRQEARHAKDLPWFGKILSMPGKAARNHPMATWLISQIIVPSLY